MTVSAANPTRQVFVVLMRQLMTVGIVVTFPPNENPAPRALCQISSQLEWFLLLRVPCYGRSERDRARSLGGYRQTDWIRRLDRGGKKHDILHEVRLARDKNSGILIADASYNRMGRLASSTAFRSGGVTANEHDFPEL